MQYIYPMWKMCFVFRLREIARNRDHIRSELESQGLSGIELENRTLQEQSKAKNYGISKEDATGAYIHYYYPELRSDRNLVDVNKVRQENPGVVDEAIRALNDCIQSGLIREEDDKVFLERGRIFAGPRYWSFRGKKWNIQLLNKYLEELGHIKTTFIAIFGSSIVTLGLKSIVLESIELLSPLPQQINALMELIRINF